MINITPAILPADFSELEEKVSSVKGLVSLVQIDITDKTFTDEATWPYKKPDMNFESILKEERGMPFWEDVDYEIDLMVKKPEEVVEDWIITGATRLIIHSKSSENLGQLIDDLYGRIEIYLGLEIEDDISVIEKYIDKISGVQTMGISVIGHQGHPYAPEVIPKIKEIRNKYPSLPISVDGGVNLENAKDLIDAGATRLVCGSYLFESNNIVEAYDKIRNI
ncbi:MAG: hypothetical protein Q7R78_00860 [bacterium]|nr:hypothetical protein [bacterium]